MNKIILLVKKHNSKTYPHFCKREELDKIINLEFGKNLPPVFKWDITLNGHKIENPKVLASQNDTSFGMGNPSELQQKSKQLPNLVKIQHFFIVVLLFVIWKHSQIRNGRSLHAPYVVDSIALPLC